MIGEDQLFGYLGMELDSPTVRLTYCLRQLIGGDVFQQVSLRAGFQRRDDTIFLAKTGQDRARGR